jgi:A/G-specific adenine glycosylase
VVEQPLPAAKPTIQTLSAALTPDARAGDFAQAMMDLGATICTPKKPACVLCPWMEMCAARTRGDPESFPRKTDKKIGTLRRGAAFVALRVDGFILTRPRPEKGLLGGMTEVPTTEWTHDFEDAAALDGAPLKAKWRRVPGVVTHTFTHFPLELIVYRADVPAARRAPSGTRWTALADLPGEALPNVMRKVVFHVLKNQIA